MRIFVTGSTGFIGRKVVELLVDKGHDLMLLVRDRSRALDVFGDNPGGGFMEGDLGDISAWHGASKDFGPDAVIHLAWEGLPDYSTGICRRNLEHGKELFVAAAQAGCKCILSAGSCWEYMDRKGLLGEDSGIDTSSEFAVAKNSLRLFGEKICRQYDIKFYWPRIFYVYGPGQRQTSVMPSVIDAFQNGILPSIKNPKNRNDFVYVNDVAKAITGLIETMCDNVIYNIGSGCSVSVEDVMLMISDMVRFKNDNGKAGFARQASGSEDFWADITRIGNDIGWSPEYSLADGIRETVNHYETNIFAMEKE